ncbi:MAG: RNase adapter RapZ [Eubacterium sp.]|nr:RNase adapter RapZ [Eubacterium sp.]
MRFVIVTGMSGAGKSSAMKILEDDGYFCVDNLPVSLLQTFVTLMEGSSEQLDRVALGLDIRAGSSAIAEAGPAISTMRKEGYPLEILFLEADQKVLVKRYKETRRMHPLGNGGRVDSAIEEEAHLLRDLRKQADYIIDTSNLLIRQLKQDLDRIFVKDEDFCNFYLNFVSFGFKYGIPSDADLVFDVRFLPNPFYVDSLKPLTGNDKDVYDFVMADEKAGIFLNKLRDMLEFLVPNYIAEGKTQLVVAIGCTGGKHRSVTLTNAIYKEFEKSNYASRKEHRDIEKDRVRNNVIRQ